MQSNEGKAEYQRALQKAAQVRALAEAEAEKVARVGMAQAIAIEEQVRAYGGPQFQLTQQVMNRFAEAVEQSKVDVVPRVIVGSTGTGSSGSVMEGLLTLMLSEKLGGVTGISSPVQRSPQTEALRQELMDRARATKSEEAPEVKQAKKSPA